MKFIGAARRITKLLQGPGLIQPEGEIPRQDRTRTLCIITVANTILAYY